MESSDSDQHFDGEEGLERDKEASSKLKRPRNIMTIGEFLDLTIIQDNFAYLAEKLPPDDVALEMRSKGLLTPREYNAYLLKKGRWMASSDWSAYLLQCLLKQRKPGSLEAFCAILRDVGPAAAYLADFLEEARRKALEGRGDVRGLEATTRQKIPEELQPIQSEAPRTCVSATKRSSTPRNLCCKFWGILLLVLLSLLLVGGGIILIVIGCLGLSGEETCDNRDIKELGENNSTNPYNTATPHKFFDAHNLLFGLACFGAPLVILGIVLVHSWRDSDHVLCIAAYNVVAVLLVVYILLLITLLVTSSITIFFGFDTLHVLESIDNSTVAMEVCSPWSLYSAIVTSTVYVGTPILGSIIFFIIALLFAIVFNCGAVVVMIIRDAVKK